MKKNAFFVICLVGAFGVVMFLNQQPQAPSITAFEEPIVKKPVPQVPSDLPEFVEEEVTVEEKVIAEEKQPMTREEAFAMQQQASLEASGLLEKFKKGGTLESEFQRVRDQHAKTFSANQRAKDHLNIDVVEKFGVDIDAEREVVRTKMRKENDAELDKRLVALGVAPELRKEFLANRDLVLGAAKKAEE